jgi:hypothetical protein
MAAEKTETDTPGAAATTTGSKTKSPPACVTGRLPIAKTHEKMGFHQGCGQ